MSASAIAAVFVLALLQGALIAAPRPDALRGVGRARSTGWALVLPGMILLGTFALALVPSLAHGLPALCAVITPPLALVSVLAVVRAGRFARFTLAAAALGILAGGWVEDLSTSTLTALGCLALGVALARLIPRRLQSASVLGMCALDSALIGTGPGQVTGATARLSAPAPALASAGRRAKGLLARLHIAKLPVIHLPGVAHQASLHTPVFDVAHLGPIMTQYPDLLLAAAIGGLLAGRPDQRTAALLAVALVGCFGLGLAYVNPLPATVPLTLAFLLAPALHRRLAQVRGRFA